MGTPTLLCFQSRNCFIDSAVLTNKCERSVRETREGVLSVTSTPLPLDIDPLDATSSSTTKAFSNTVIMIAKLRSFGDSDADSTA